MTGRLNAVYRPERYVASGSRLPLLAKCAASVALPQFPRDNPKADMGSALHEHMRDRIGLGISDAVARLDSVAEAWHLFGRERDIFKARAKHFEFTPPRGAIPEMALCLFEDGHVEPVVGGRGKYVVPPGGILPLSLDIMWAEPLPLYRTPEGAVRCPPESVLYVADLKTGQEKYVDPVEVNMQAIAEALLAAKWTGATHVVPVIIFWGKGKGVWDMPDAPLGPEQLDAADGYIRGLLAEGARQRAAYEAGEPLSYRTGPQCLYCDASPGCPAKIGEVKQLLGVESPLSVGPMTNEQATRIAILQPLVAQLADKMREALVAHADGTGESIPIGLGKAWGPYVSTKEAVDARKALPLLEEEVGKIFAHQFVQMKLTKTAIADAVRAAHVSAGIKRQMSSAVARVLARAHEVGAIVTRTKLHYGVHPISNATARLPAALEYDEADVDGDADD